MEESLTEESVFGLGCGEQNWAVGSRTGPDWGKDSSGIGSRYKTQGLNLSPGEVASGATGGSCERA